MKKIVIVGSSIAGVAAAKKIRETDKDSEIVLYSMDGHYPCDRNKFAGFISQEFSEEDVLLEAMEFYEKNSILVILDKKISRINLKCVLMTKFWTKSLTNLVTINILILSLHLSFYQ